MQKLFLILCGLIFLNTANAQKYFKPSGRAFSILIQPGNIAVDEIGIPTKRKINKERFIYILTGDKVRPIINSIFYGPTAVKWELLSTSEKEFSAVQENTQKAVNIKPTYGNSIWRIIIQEIPNNSISDKALPIIIKGKKSNKPFTVLINTETALQGFESY